MKLRISTCLQLVALAGVLAAPSIALGQQAGQPSAVDAASLPLAGATFSGGPLRSVLVQTDNSPFQSTSTSYVNLPNSNIGVTVPPGGGLLVVTFSGECRLFGAGAFDWVEIRVLVNGSPIQPNDTVSPTAFCGADSYSLNSGVWAKRVAAGGYRVQVQVKDTNNSGNTESIWVDDHTLKVEEYQ